MLLTVLTWIGVALGATLLLLMALGPSIVELDGWLAEHKRDRRQAKVAAARQKVAAREATPAIVPRAA